MLITDIVLNDKIQDAIADKAQFKLYEGVFNSSKSIAMILELFSKVWNLGEDEGHGNLIGASSTLLEKNFVNNSASITNLFPGLCEYKSNGTAGKRFELYTPRGTKYIYLVGADNKTRWQKALEGSNDKVFGIDEIASCDIEAVGEAVGRTIRNNGTLIATSNGWLPDADFYKKHFDKGRPHPKYRHEVPISTIQHLEKTPADDNWSYWFFTLYDNPTNSQEWIDKVLTGIGHGGTTTFKYRSQVLGERGVAGGLLFGDLFTEFSSLDPSQQYIEINVGVDLGKAEDVHGRETKHAQTIAVIGGIRAGYAGYDPIAYKKFSYKTHNDLAKQLDEWLKSYREKYRRINYVFVDDSLHALVRAIYEKIKYAHVDYCKKPPIPDRTDLIYQMKANGVMNFGHPDLANNFNKLIEDPKKPNFPIDENRPENDMFDGTCYPFTHAIKKMAHAVAQL